ncbi:hypothetical protein R1flu_014874 [Riccia fluitans]|uniref:Uncharacterized protein n=1 Tax=Riccia fluitans TaxID=41844 RepID=A0ABD1YHQ6_9MARC
MEESVSQMTTMLSNILERHGRANQRLASLEENLAHAKLEEEKLKAMIEALEKVKSEMNARMALMKGPLRFVGSQDGRLSDSQPSGMIGGFENLNLTITKKWVETLNLEELKKCPADYSEYAPLARGWDGWK